MILQNITEDKTLSVPGLDGRLVEVGPGKRITVGARTGVSVLGNHSDKFKEVEKEVIMKEEERLQKKKKKLFF